MTDRRWRSAAERARRRAPTIEVGPSRSIAWHRDWPTAVGLARESDGRADLGQPGPTGISGDEGSDRTVFPGGKSNLGVWGRDIKRTETNGCQCSDVHDAMCHRCANGRQRRNSSACQPMLMR
jgi:hypothetical protein